MIGVVAPTREQAQQLIDLLGVDGQPFTSSRGTMRGYAFDAVILDENVNATEEVLHSARLVSHNNVYTIGRA